MWQFIVSHLADIFMVLCGIFAGAAIIVLEVAIGTVIEKDILSRLLPFGNSYNKIKKSPRQSGGFCCC